MANSSTSKKSAFEILNAINVNDHTEVKDTGKVKLTYLSWAWAWAEVKKAYPDANYEIVKFDDGIPYAYDSNTGYMVYTRVTIEGITHEMWLPVMDGNNRAMKDEPYEVKTKYNTFTVAAATMFDVNKTIMRCLVKNLAMFGLGLYIYAGEDLPEDDNSQIQTPEQPSKPQKAPQKAQAKRKQEFICQNCKKPITDAEGHSVQEIVASTKKQFDMILCMECGHEVQRYKKYLAEQKKVEEAQQTAGDIQLPFPIEQ